MQGKNIGIVSTFNQQCRISASSKYLVDALCAKSIKIFAEQVKSELLTTQEDPRVLRVWSRNSSDYASLTRSIDEAKIDILHVNYDPQFFHFPKFVIFLNNCYERGIKIITTLYRPHTLTNELSELATYSDTIVVTTPENRLEVIAGGVDPSRIKVIEHGVPPILAISKDLTRNSLNISKHSKIIVCFGFVKADKGIEEVVSAMSGMLQSMPNLHLYIVGGADSEDSESQEYLISLKRLTIQRRLETNIHFIEGFLPETVVDNYLKAADVILMNYRSQNFEASSAICKALASGNPVITSTAPAFARLGGSVFRITKQFPMNAAIKLVLESDALQQALHKESTRWCEDFSWPKIAKEFSTLYSELMASPAHQRSSILNNTEKSNSISFNSDRLKVLMKNRPNVYTNAGGDTVMMERTAQGLRELGITVDIDIGNSMSPKEYDLVHLFNFATPEITEAHARLCVSQKTPYVVSTLYEDLPSFYNQMANVANVLVNYINLKQPRDKWAELRTQFANVQASGPWGNAYTAQHAACLIATGDRERITLLRDYPGATVALCKCGCNISDTSDNGEMFIAQYGLSDFVLCVGRLETRKNQLMLLKALEESKLTLVFATGGFTYQPDYEAACRAFKRAGKTVFLDKLEPRMLASAYRAARIHALPSWYELPGLVSMEAVRAENNIVVCDRGTPRDYFGDKAFYCLPDDEQSIFQAVVGAYYCPTIDGIEKTVSECTWHNAAIRYLDIYKQVMNRTAKSEVNAGLALTEEPLKQLYSEKELVQNINATTEREIKTKKNPEAPELSYKLCDEGDEMASQYKIEQAREKYELARVAAPKWSRPYRSLGVISLGEGKNFQAKDWFERAISCDLRDGKAWAGKGHALWSIGHKEDAFECYKKSIEVQPNEMAFLPIIVKAGYELNRLLEIEPILRGYVTAYPKDPAVRYCLAGVYFKQGFLEKARSEANTILAISPDYAEAKQLLEVITESQIGKTWSTENSLLGIETIAQVTSYLDDMLDQLENTKHNRDYDAVLERSSILLNNSGLRPDQRARALVIEGEALACCGKITQAREKFSSVQDEPSIRTRALAGLGALALAEDKRTEAKTYFEHALLLHAKNDVAKAGLAYCAGIDGNKNEAWRLYLEALEANPENLNALLGVIELGYERKSLPQVEKVLRNYLSFHPADIPIMYSLAGCLFAQNLFGEARSELQNILVLDPRHDMSIELLREIDVRMQVNGHYGR